MAKPTFGKKETDGGAYFSAPSSSLQFISSGCRLLDCVLGGGWVLGRISNIIGDKSTGKTLLAIEACANFAHQYPRGDIYYREAEAAFDVQYAQTLGLPTSRMDFSDAFHTVEDMFEDLSKVTTGSNKRPALYIVDSLDALSDRAELGREIDKGSYGAEKAKQMSELFRRLTKKVEQSKVCVIIISQVRDNIGVTFGRKTTRSGGRALDFYSSQVVFLAHIKRLKRTISKVERVHGVTIKAFCDKNKVGLPFRECEFDIRFAYGIDDIGANLKWLAEVGRLDTLDLTKAEVPRLIDSLETSTPAEIASIRDDLDAAVVKVWYEIEQKFLPSRSKYGDTHDRE